MTLTATDSDGDTGTDSVRVTVENAPPEAMIAAPSRDTAVAAGETVTFEGSAQDPEDGALTGDALAWASDLDGDIGTGESLSTDALSEGEHLINLTATDGAGATGEATVAVTVSTASEPPPTNQPPTAEITTPADGTAYDEGATIVFDGFGSDPEDSRLTGASLVWTSNVDGEIGTGETLSFASLTAAPHTITLTATDSDGNTASASVRILVEAPGFSIRLRLLSDFTEEQKAAMEAAVDRWEAAITGDLPSFFPNGRPRLTAA